MMLKINQYVQKFKVGESSIYYLYMLGFRDVVELLLAFMFMG